MYKKLADTSVESRNTSITWLLVVLIAMTSSAYGDAIQPLPRQMKGATERAPDKNLDTTPSSPMDMKIQQGRAWKQAKVNNARASTAFLAQNAGQPGVKTLKNGLQVKTLKHGDGPKPGKDDTINVLYQGSLVDGSVFVSATSPDKPAQLKIDGQIPGLKWALVRMNVGSKLQIVVPPGLGYGDAGLPPTIGPGAVLIYEIEILGIHGKDNPSQTPNSPPLK